MSSGKHHGSLLRQQPGVVQWRLALVAMSDSGRKVLLAMWPMMVEVVRGSVLVSRLKPLASCSRHHRSVNMALGRVAPKLFNRNIHSNVYSNTT